MNFTMAVPEHVLWTESVVTVIWIRTVIYVQSSADKWTVIGVHKEEPSVAATEIKIRAVCVESSDC